MKGLYFDVPVAVQNPSTMLRSESMALRLFKYINPGNDIGGNDGAHKAYRVMWIL